MEKEETMALNPSASPAVVVKEIDLTAVVPGITTPAGAYVGNFNWGPAEEVTLIADETGLVSTFGAPSTSNTIDFHSAAYYLRYSSDLYVVRELGSSAANAYDSDNGASAPLVKNYDDFETQEAALDSDGHTWVARYAGALGNSLKVSVIGQSAGDSDFDNWTYVNEFDAAPDSNELHVVVVDQDGDITGTAGEVLEKYSFVGTASTAKNADGSTNYVNNVVNNGSQYVFAVGTVATGDTSLVNGNNGSALGTSEVLTGFDLFEDTNTVTVDFLIAPGMSSSADQTTVVNDLVAIASSTRKDCVAVTSPNRAAVINNNGSEVTDIVSGAANFTRSSYLIADGNYLKVYDKYNDQYIHIPAASSTAGLMAATSVNAAPWFSPAGTRRGQYLGVTSLAYAANKSNRDTLYKAGINPISNIPGQGILLYGDKTHLSRPSAFDRINVRRLFLTIERSISEAAKSVIFEFNDEFTRSEFAGIVEPFLREIQGARGITDFRVVCDETNNTPAVVDRNEFVASVFIKPARSINYITLNFVAVRSGVDFEEVVGTV
jgi:phage tail sheath protein FI